MNQNKLKQKQTGYPGSDPADQTAQEADLSEGVLKPSALLKGKTTEKEKLEAVNAAVDECIRKGIIPETARGAGRSQLKIETKEECA